MICTNNFGTQVGDRYELGTSCPETPSGNAAPYLLYFVKNNLPIVFLFDARKRTRYGQ